MIDDNRTICAACPDPEPCEADWPCAVVQAIEAELCPRPVEPLPDGAPWPREECGAQGPRIGDAVATCRRSKGHIPPHRIAPSDGLGNVAWDR